MSNTVMFIICLFIRFTECFEIGLCVICCACVMRRYRIISICRCKYAFCDAFNPMSGFTLSSISVSLEESRDEAYVDRNYR